MIKRILVLLTSVLLTSVVLGLVGLADAAVATLEPTHAVVRYCIPNRITVAEITLSGYPEGSTLFIEDSQTDAVNGTTTIYLTRPVQISADAYASEVGDFTEVVRPLWTCRLPKWR